MYHTRSTLRRATTAAAVAAVAAGLITAGPAAFADPPKTSSASGTDQIDQDHGVLTLDGVKPGRKTITLITGDRVTLTTTGTGSDGYAVDVDAAPRPDGHIPVFEGTFDDDSFFLFPDDARPAVASGVLDKDLFNLTYLAENGYTDAKTDSLPVIAQYPEGRSARSLSASAETLPASEPEVALSSVHATGLKVSKDDATDFWSAIAPTMAGPGIRPRALSTGIGKLWLDHRVSVSLDESVPMIGAPEAWDLGLDGTGVTVAVLDTGYDENHPDLAGTVVAAKDFTIFGDTHDGHGHGTHVASTIAGSGAASDGRYKGVAPGADLMIGKVLSDSGQGLTAWIIAGMEWAANNGADIINMSLGSGPTDGTDLASQAVNTLTESTGALFVTAAGNEGPGTSTIAAPGVAEAALTVAAVDKSDQLGGFSSRGPRVDGLMKPDIAAPGVGITAARSAGTDMGGHAAVVDEFYAIAGGTSMATPHVAGAAAILVQRHPDWTPGELKTALMSTSVDDGYSAFEQGSGRVDIASAIDQTVFAATPNADFGNIPADAGPVTRQITYRNTGDSDVTLTLTPSLRRANGDLTPDGTLSADDHLRVPAGGTATATVTLTADDLAVATYTGAIVATDETTGTHLRTPVGFRRQPPMHTLTVKVLGRDGQPATTKSIRAIDVSYQLGDFARFGHWVSPGVFETQVPEGITHILAPFSWIDESRRYNYGYLIDPEVEVSGDTETTLDARDLNKISFNTSRPAEVPASGGSIDMNVRRTMAQGAHTGAYVNAANFTQFWLTPTEPLSAGDLQVFASMSLAAPEVTMRVRGASNLDLHPMTYPHIGRDFRGKIGELFTGSQTLRLADAGLGRPEDLVGLDLTGKLALLEMDTECSIHMDRMHNLRDAGAVGVLSWPSGEVDTSGCINGPTIPLDVVNTSDDQDPNIGVPHVSLPPGEALALRDRLDHGRVQIAVTGTPVSPYVYEAAPFALGQVPDSVTFDLTDRHVARVDTEYHATKPAQFEPEWISFTADASLLFSSVRPPLVVAPTTRVHYVGPLSDQVVHLSSILMRDMSDFNNYVDFWKVNLYDEPVRSRVVWNGAAGVPGSTTYANELMHMNDPDTPPMSHWNFGVCAMCREGDELYPVFDHAFGEREYRMAFIAPSLTHLYQGHREIPINSDGDIPSFTMPSEPGDYRLTLEDPTVRTETEWTFHSRGTADEPDAANGLRCPTSAITETTDCRPEPLVYATYDLGSRLGLDNKVRAGGAHLFTINAYHAPSRAEMPRIAGVRLWYSLDDGRHWIPALTIPKGDGEYQALTIYPPHGLTSGAVSLKLQAWDQAGNTLTQTTTRAFELRESHHRGHGPTAQ